MEEEKLLNEIAKISSQEDARKYKEEFDSVKNAYTYEEYISILRRIIRVLLNGISEPDLVIQIIRTNTDGIL